MQVQCRWWFVHLGSSRGGDFWGGVVTTSPEDKERSCRCPLRGEAPSWGHFHMATNDKDSGHFPAAQGREGQWGSRMPGDSHLEKSGMGTSSGEKSHLPAPPACHPHPPLRGQGCLSSICSWDPREMAESPGLAMSTNSHTGRGSRNWYTRTKIKTPNSLEKPGPAWSCSPSQRRGRKRPCRGRSVRSTSRRTRPACPRSTGRGGSSPRE